MLKQIATSFVRGAAWEAGREAGPKIARAIMNQASHQIHRLKNRSDETRGVDEIVDLAVDKASNAAGAIAAGATSAAQAAEKLYGSVVRRGDKDSEEPDDEQHEPK